MESNNKIAKESKFKTILEVLSEPTLVKKRENAREEYVADYIKQAVENSHKK